MLLCVLYSKIIAYPVTQLVDDMSDGSGTLFTGTLYYIFLVLKQ